MGVSAIYLAIYLIIETFHFPMFVGFILRRLLFIVHRRVSVTSYYAIVALRPWLLAMKELLCRKPSGLPALRMKIINSNEIASQEAGISECLAGN
jgi:hypothetical protein